MEKKRGTSPSPPLSFFPFPLPSRLLVALYPIRHGRNIFCAVAVRSEKKKIIKRQLVLIIVELWCFLWVMGLRIHKQIRKALQRESAGNKSFLLGLSKAYEVLVEFFRLTV